ncbi:MAG: hypothetical protein AAB617_01305 [Patescibacteria group bacterium]
MNYLIKNIIYFFERLAVKPIVGGLQISDSGLQYLSLGKDGPESYSLRLTPGIIKEGKLQDPKQLLSSLESLHKIIFPNDHLQKVQAIVSLPPPLIFTQSFSVPNIGEEKLGESAELNMQMISPINAGEAYMGWEIIKETEERYELIGVFAPKGNIDGYKSILEQANFLPIVFEFPALALARVVASVLKPREEPILLLHVSSDGLNILIIRNGVLSFDYFRSWLSIQGDAREISRELFRGVVQDEVKKVVNFSITRFKSGINQIFILAPGFEEEIKILIEDRFGLKTTNLVLTDYKIAPVWYPTLGSALRGKIDRSKDRFINLASESSSELFYEEQVVNFIRIWRTVIVGTLMIFVLVFGISVAFLTSQSNKVSVSLAGFGGQSSQTELLELNNSSVEFNYLTHGIAKIKSSAYPWHEVLLKIKKLTDENNIDFQSLGFGTSDSSVSLSAKAPSNSQVLRFKNILVKEPGISDVDLPLSSINSDEDSSVTFVISFKMKV